MHHEAPELLCLRVDDDLDPTHERIAEALEPREVGKRLAGFRIAQRMVDALPVRVAVNEQHLAGKIDRLVAQRFKQLAIAAVAESRSEVLEPRIALQGDDERR